MFKMVSFYPIKIKLTPKCVNHFAWIDYKSVYETKYYRNVI